MAYGALWVIVITVAGVGILQLAHRHLAATRGRASALPIESGWAPQQHALSRFHVRWYPATLVFLAFDVEMVFMYPWAVVVGRLGGGAVAEMFLFLGALLLTVVWAWREGAFRWV